MIAVLPAAFGIAPNRLQVALGDGANPHIRPGRWDHKRTDPLEVGRVAKRFSIGTDVSKRPSVFNALDAWAAASYVAQPSFGSRFDRI